MMLHRLLILLMSLVATQSLTANPKAEAALNPSEAMQKYAESLSFLLQNLGRPASQDKTLQAQISEHLSRLTNISHDIQGSMQSMAIDPLMIYLSVDMPQQFSRIEQEFIKGNHLSARQQLRHATQYCLACHSSSVSKHSVKLQFSDPTTRLTLLEQAEYFSATRQHEKALLAYEKILAESNIARQDPQTWLQAISNMLAMTVRMQRSSHLSLETSSRFLHDSAQLNPEQLAVLRSWRQSAKEWTQEKRQERSPEELLIHAETLLNKGKSHKNPNHGFVDLLRAMNFVDDLALRTTDAGMRAKGFRLSGQAMERMAGVYVWMRPDVYYEACIRSHPKSAEARQCWQDLSSHLQLTPAALQKFPWYQGLFTLAHG